MDLDPRTDRAAGLKLLEVGTTVHFDIIETNVERPEQIDEVLVDVDLQLGEEEDGDRTEDWEWGSFGFMFALAVLSFAGARPRNVSGEWMEQDDDLTMLDFFEGLRFQRGQLSYSAHYIRGRYLKTDIDVSAEGRVRLRTRNRGEAALRWLDRLKGQQPLELVRS